MLDLADVGNAAKLANDFDRVQLFRAHFEQLFFTNLLFDRVKEYPDNHTFIEALWQKVPTTILVLRITDSKDFLSRGESAALRVAEQEAVEKYGEQKSEVAQYFMTTPSCARRPLFH